MMEYGPLDYSLDGSSGNRGSSGGTRQMQLSPIREL